MSMHQVRHSIAWLIRISIVAGGVILLIGFTAPVARADNCGSYNDCFYTIGATLLAALGAMTIAAILLYVLPEAIGLGSGSAEATEAGLAEGSEGLDEPNAAAETAELVESPVSPGRLTQSEFDQLLAVASKYDTEIDVVGSRASGMGHNIESDLPVGKGNNTHSDINVRIDGQTDIDSGGKLSGDLKNIGGNLVNIVDSWLPEVPSKPPYIRITPNGGFVIK